jgi:hypothetical protein
MRATAVAGCRPSILHQQWSCNLANEVDSQQIAAPVIGREVVKQKLQAQSGALDTRVYRGGLQGARLVLETEGACRKVDAAGFLFYFLGLLLLPVVKFQAALCVVVCCGKIPALVKGPRPEQLKNPSCLPAPHFSGIRGLYRGYFLTLSVYIPQTITFFVLYERLKLLAKGKCYILVEDIVCYRRKNCYIGFCRPRKEEEAGFQRLLCVQLRCVCCSGYAVHLVDISAWRDMRPVCDAAKSQTCAISIVAAPCPIEFGHVRHDIECLSPVQRRQLAPLI